MTTLRSAVSTATIATALLSCGDRREPEATQATRPKPKVKIAPIPDVADPYARPPVVAPRPSSR